ncbi:DUF1850 domain-containing protein [Defluviitalea raffinosedens]|uniref:DUF1850 domain-containing protein n=1 Tax=Defluviitalea raffinosedens TaxID=1450156 RepID=A0A7C8HG73_9FIRM|nr:DUF1850 domain-containing protein [Defluviitalea raffinosedens]KAE9636990.1 DUF1850 domain-containing protein [Defluviitalea raffinosedens]HHW67304.1 DUF1850 domain-containing protein [Candidatus Epulonipiscium sp.]
MKRINLLTGAAIVAVLFTVSVILFFVFSSPCLILKNSDTGEIIASFPVNDGDEFSVTFIHSVNNSPVTDVYQIRTGKMYVDRTIYYAFGAGVQTEIEEGQSLEYGSDGAMIVSGFNKLMDRLSYIVGTVSDHILHINGKDISLRELCGKNTTVQFVTGRRFISVRNDEPGNQ